MRIVYFTESLYPHVDGVSRTLARLFETLLRRDIDFQIFSPFVPDADIPWADRVREVRSFRFPPYPDYRVSIPAFSGIPEQLRALQPDLIHVVSPTPMGYRAQKWARDLGIPAVASFHTHFVSYFRYYGIEPMEGFGWSLLRRFYRNCEQVYAPSPSIVRELEQQGIQGVRLWSRGIDLDGFSPDRADPAIHHQLGIDPSVPILLMVSRLVKEKDLLDLLQIDSVLGRRGVEYKMVLVGDGPLRQKLEEGLPHAHFAGHQSGDQLARWYASSDVFVFPSTTETLGNVVLEAAASGVPAVVVDRGGPQDIVFDGETGFVARANDIDDIADKLSSLLTDPELRKRLGRQARERADSRDWEEINGTMVDDYSRVIDQFSGAKG